MTVVVIDTVGDDLKAGKSFYDSCEIGVGDYFVESLLADLHSLKLYGGIHLRQFGFYRMLSKRLPFRDLLSERTGDDICLRNPRHAEKPILAES